ncbi:TPA: DUF551 domain-containing protein [Enterobacter ludwigii]
MSTITREFTKEQLIEHIKGRKEFADECAVDSTLHPERREYYELTAEALRIALASLGAEAVAWQWKYRDKNHVTNDQARAKFVAQDGDVTVQPLYTSPPAPTSSSLISELLAIAKKAAEAADECAHAEWNDDSMEHSAAISDWERRAAMQSVVLAENLEMQPILKDSHQITGYEYMGERYSTTVGCAWNTAIRTCRAAMLQGSDGNSPVIPDGWVACSERMPEVGVKVLCFPVNDEPIHATYNGQVWLQDISWSASDEPIDNVISCNVFHWMPLPAAPQHECKHEFVYSPLGWQQSFRYGYLCRFCGKLQQEDL